MRAGHALGIAADTPICTATCDKSRTAMVVAAAEAERWCHSHTACVRTMASECVPAALSGACGMPISGVLAPVKMRGTPKCGFRPVLGSGQHAHLVQYWMSCVRETFSGAVVFTVSIHFLCLLPLLTPHLSLLGAPTPNLNNAAVVNTVHPQVSLCSCVHARHVHVHQDTRQTQHVLVAKKVLRQH